MSRMTSTRSRGFDRVLVTLGIRKAYDSGIRAFLYAFLAGGASTGTRKDIRLPQSLFEDCGIYIELPFGKRRQILRRILMLTGLLQVAACRLCRTSNAGVCIERNATSNEISGTIYIKNIGYRCIFLMWPDL